MRTLGGYFFWEALILRFAKPALSLEQQLDRLIDRGLSVPNRQQGLHYLRHLNYYRLGAYWLPFEEDHGTHRFRASASLDDVINLYVFDRAFRLLVMDAIERIEVSVRTAWAYHMAHVHGSHCHLQHDLFKPSWRYASYRQKLVSEVARSQETFIRHLRTVYDEPLPPIWALVEVMTFGQLSQWYANTRQRQDRNAVARQYGIDERVLVSLLHHLTTIRNMCAHHARLWNREVTVLPKLPSVGPGDLLASLSGNADRRVYNTLVMMLHLMNEVSPGHHWKSRLVGLLETHRIDPAAMGFPPDWQDRPLWRH